MKTNVANTGSKCPCGSKKQLDDCCLRVINGSVKALSAEQLMRSRYTAYALRNEQYVLDSWHSSTRPSGLGLELETSMLWTGLNIQKVSAEENNTAYVEFVARFNNEGVAGQIHERSRFVREQGYWFYVDGEQIESAMKAPGRNDPCHCGSGKKFKKCCGKNSGL